VLRRGVEILDACLPEVALLLRVRGNTATERWARQRRREFTDLLARLVQQAIDEGDLRPDLDARLVARLLFGMANSLVEWYRRGGPGRLGPDEIGRAIETIAFDGLSRRRADYPRG
jgi:hypothetical protein